MTGGIIEQLTDNLKMSNAENSVLRTQINRQQRDIDRLRSRDGNATITLCYNDGNHPFAREHLKIVDVGVADNCYVVESEVVTNLQSANSALQKQVEELKCKVKFADEEYLGMHDKMSAKIRDLESQCDDLEKINKAYLIENMALRHYGSRVNCAYCNHEMVDLHPGDGGESLRKLIIDHMDKCEKHPLFEARKRIRELEAEVAAKDDLLRLALPIVRRDYFKSSESLAEEIDKALSTPTGSKLLAKVEAGEGVKE